MRKVSEQYASDVITTAVEGGIGYWADILSYRWKDVPHTTAEIVEREASMDNRPALKATLNRELVQKGINVIAEGKLRVNREILGRILASAVADEADIDAIEADVVIQAGVFGEIVYG